MRAKEKTIEEFKASLLCSQVPKIGTKRDKHCIVDCHPQDLVISSNRYWIHFSASSRDISNASIYL